jgi:hypothetical protein
MSEEFGAGIALDEDLDFTISGTGDLGTASGRDELEKDLSFQLIFSLRQHLGELVSDNLKAEVKNTAKQVVELDERVREFNESKSTVTFPDRGSETIKITIPVIIEDNDSYEFVFEVSK